MRRGTQVTTRYSSPRSSHLHLLSTLTALLALCHCKNASRLSRPFPAHHQQGAAPSCKPDRAVPETTAPIRSQALALLSLCDRWKNWARPRRVAAELSLAAASNRSHALASPAPSLVPPFRPLRPRQARIHTCSTAAYRLRIWIPTTAVCT